MVTNVCLRGLFGAALLFSLVGCRHTRLPELLGQGHHVEYHPGQKPLESCSQRLTPKAHDQVQQMSQPSQEQLGREFQRWFLEGLERFGQYGIIPREFPLHEFGTCQIQPYVMMAHDSPDAFRPYAKKVTLVSKGKRGRATVYEIETKTGQRISYIIPAQPYVYDVAEALLALSATSCQTVLFLGSAISASKDVQCGDLMIPETAIYGHAANVYLSPDTSFVQRINAKVYACNSDVFDYLCQEVQGFLETNPQFKSRIFHGKILSDTYTDGVCSSTKKMVHSLHCCAVDLSVTAVYHMAETLGINAVALLSISGQLSATNDSSGRARLPLVQKEVIPQIALSFFQKLPRSVYRPHTKFLGSGGVFEAESTND